MPWEKTVRGVSFFFSLFVFSFISLLSFLLFSVYMYSFLDFPHLQFLSPFLSSILHPPFLSRFVFVVSSSLLVFFTFGLSFYSSLLFFTSAFLLFSFPSSFLSFFPFLLSFPFFQLHLVPHTSKKNTHTHARGNRLTHG